MDLSEFCILHIQFFENPQKGELHNSTCYTPPQDI